MVKYNKSKIYKIYAEGHPDKYYIAGCALDYLSQRMFQHLSDFNKWKENKTDPTPLFEFMDTEPIHTYRIALIEKFPCNNKKELDERINQLILENKPNAVNTPRKMKPTPPECIVCHKAIRKLRGGSKHDGGQYHSKCQDKYHKQKQQEVLDPDQTETSEMNN